MSAPSDNYDWLAQARADSQKALRCLYRLGQGKRDAFLADAEAHSIFGLLVGSAFSLWRAAFLSYAKRTPQDIHDNACKVLRIILEDNAIAYMGDKKTKEWMGGYYVNSARFRLERAWPKIAELTGRPEPPESVGNLLNLPLGIGEGSLMATWDRSHSALLYMIGQLDELLGRGVPPPNPPLEPTAEKRGGSASSR